MPELPEVETVVRGLRREGLAGHTIRDVQIAWPRIIATPAPEAFCRRVTGRRINAITRRGKYIVLSLDAGETVLIHLRMTGRLAFASHTAPRSRHEHVVLALDDDRQLRYHDTRKFGRWHVVTEPSAVLGRMGPEPLDRNFTPVVLSALLRQRARQLKPLLLDQHVLAGLGNIYVDEALWAARLHPLRSSATLQTRQVDVLHAAILAVLRRGIRAQGTTLGSGKTNFYSVAGRRGRNQDGLQVFRRTGEPCPRCAATIQRIIVAQRSTHLCPRCQRAPG